MYVLMSNGKYLKAEYHSFGTSVSNVSTKSEATNFRSTETALRAARQMISTYLGFSKKLTYKLVK